MKKCARFGAFHHEKMCPFWSLSSLRNGPVLEPFILRKCTHVENDSVKGLVLLVLRRRVNGSNSRRFIVFTKVYFW